MKRNQVEVAFDELEASNPLTTARIWLKLTKANGETASIEFEAGGYDLFMEDELLVVRYDYAEGDVTYFTRTPERRHVGVEFIPFDSILAVELIAEGEAE